MSPTEYRTHKRILLHILKDVYTDVTVAPALGFKGGTAAMLFYGLERHSVDLDFDLLLPAQHAVVHERIQTIVGQYGTISELQEKRATILCTISPGLHRPHIKVEINLRQFPSHYEYKTLLGIPMQVMVPADMFAHKLMALYERKGYASRDIFDVHEFFKRGWEYNPEIIEVRSGTSVRHVLETCITHIERMNEATILDGLGSLLSEEKRTWARQQMKGDTIFQLSTAVVELA